jgi:hypothetical protein
LNNTVAAPAGRSTQCKRELNMEFAELSQRAEYRQIVETIAKDMTRRWIKITAQGDEDKTDRVAAIGDALKKYQIREKFRRLGTRAEVAR